MNNINASNINGQYDQLRKQIAEQDIYRAFCLNANSMHPETAKGYLVKTRNPISNFVIATADTGKDVVELGKALVKGESNDNQLGRFNDLGMKLGGLGIAAYLSSRRSTGTKAAMEFLGPVAFFASMAMWPKLLISAPLQMKHGFDIRQKYIDSQGRKKIFFQDNQYLPWSMWSDEEIDKVADKMGISKDVNDRRELTREKMRTIALQGNTLWMLTAGFSPLLTSMICNVAERGVTKYIVNNQYNKALKQVNGLEAAAKAAATNPSFDREGSAALKSLTARYLSTEPDKQFFKEAASIADPFRVIFSLKDVDNRNIIKGGRDFAPHIQESLEESYKAFRNNSTFSYDAFTDLLKKNIKFSADEAVSYSAQGDEIIRTADDAISDLSTHLFGTKGYKQGAKTTFAQVDEALKGMDGLTAKKIKSVLDTQSPDKNSLEQFFKTVSNLYEGHTRPLSARVDKITSVINDLVGQKYESVNTDIHLTSIKEFMKELNPSTENLKQIRNSVKSSQEYLVNTLGNISQNDDSYAEFVKNLSTLQSKFQAKSISDIISKVQTYSDITFKKYGIDTYLKENTSILTGLEKGLEARIESGALKQQWQNMGGADDAFDGIVKLCREVAKDSKGQISDKIFNSSSSDEAAKVLKLLFGERADEVFEGVSSNPLIKQYAGLFANEKSGDAPMWKRMINMFIEEKCAGIEATNYRYLLAGDLEKRLQSGLLKQQWADLGGDPKKFQETVKICHDIMYQHTMNDVSNKFLISKNAEDAAKIVKLLFMENMDDATLENCDDAVRISLKRARKNITDIYSSVTDYARPNHTVGGGILAAQKTKYSMIGKPVAELLMENASKSYNDKHWMKMFGGLSIAVVGITLIAQKFFGKVKDENLYKKDNKQVNGGVKNAK